MVDLAVQKNPYTPPDHAKSAEIFFGRETFFDQLLAVLQAQDEETSRPIILSGLAKIGKTSILQQIANGRFSPAYLPILIDLNEITLDSISSFYWDLAHHIRAKINLVRPIELPAFNQTAFVAAPLQAFFLQLVKPLAAALNHQKLLLLFDNLNHVIQQIRREKLSPNLIVDLHNELRQANNAASIFAITLPDNQLTVFDELPFAQWVQEFAVTPLTEDEVYTIIRDPVGYTIVKDVARYIFELTEGLPAYTQQLCYALFEYRQKNNLQHVTVADVITVQKQMVDRGNTAVSPHLPTFTIQPNPAHDKTIYTINHQSPWYKQPLFLIPLAFVLISLAILLLPTLTQQRNNPTTNSIAALSFTPTANVNGQETNSPNSTAPSIGINSSPTSTPLSSITPTVPPAETPTETPTNTPTATSTAAPDTMPKLTVREQDQMQMVFIPAGTFLMGSDEQDVLAATDEQPQHEVKLTAFYIDKYEINVKQYAAFLNRLGTYQRACDNVDCTLPRNLAGYTNYLEEQDLGDGTIQYFPMTGFANYPANHISWYGANSYCQSISARLPTEAEWEYAARGTDGRIYPWGNKVPDETLAIFQSDSFENMKPVDALPDGASPFGVFGMAGSLWEWTSDWYDENYYSEAPTENPQGPETGFARVARGGSWPFNNQAERIRSSNRFSLSPDFISSTVGFRCARDP